MKIINAAGVWLINTAQYRFVDPESGAIFEPQEPTKATHTDWVKGQPCMKQCNEDGSYTPAPTEAPTAAPTTAPDEQAKSKK